MQYFSYLLFRGIIFLFWLIPFWLLYRMSDLLAFLMYRVFAYRRKVIRANLKNAFPKKSAKELQIIEQKFYTHLCDILLEGIKGLSMSKASIKKRYDVRQDAVEYMNTFCEQKSLMVVGGHYGNWEWGAIGATLHVIPDIVIFYKPVKNKYLDAYIRRTRSIHNTYLRSIKETKQSFEEFKDQNLIYIMIADQNPSNRKAAHWVNFMNQETAVLHGPSKYSQEYELPLFFLHTRRLKRGYYQVYVDYLPEAANLEDFNAISQLFMSKLEEDLREEPSHWLWSHRRWKYTRENMMK
ncbi:MAG: hypothetical protein MK212_14775 [Saprospiraceae bacterium]|nr:hypothetical protein [Saprospiraceae bacterium]